MENSAFRVDLGNIFSKAWKLFLENLKAILAVVLIVHIPENLIIFLISDQGDKDIALRVISRLIITIVTLLAVIADMALVFITSRAADGINVNFKEVLRLAAGRWGAAIGTNIIMGFILLLLMILLIVPAFIWIVYYTFVDQVVALRDLSGKEALDYSKTTVKGNWWKILGYTIAITIVPAVLVFALVNGIPYITNDYFGIAWLEIIVKVLNNFIYAFGVIGVTLLFFEVERQKSIDLSEITTYEKFNKLINNESVIDDTEEDTAKIIGEEEWVLKCPECGTRITPNDDFCPLCQTAVR